MDKKLQKKIARFIKLSEKFTKTAVDVFGQSDIVTGLDITGSIVGSNSVVFGKTQSVSQTRAELILKEAQERATLSDEYDEYLSLQKLLGEYFKITDKLNN